MEKLDALVLKRAETMGRRLGLSTLVHLRFSEWDSYPNGPALFERYGKALAKSARRFQKKESVPIDDPDLQRARFLGPVKNITSFPKKVPKAVR